MAKYLAGLTLFATILAGTTGTVWAQDAQEDAPAIEIEDAQPNATDSEFPIVGAPVEPEFSTEVFGDWELRCTADNSECFLYQLILNAGGDPVSEMSVVALPSGGEAVTGATVVTPLGTLLQAGVTFQIDAGPQQKFPFSWCLRSGCFSRFGLPPEGLASLKAGAKATMTLAALDLPNEPIVLEVSLAGFTAGYNAMAAKTQ